MPDTKKRKLIFCLIGCFAALLVAIVCYTQIFYSADKLFSDRLYQTPTASNRNIKIIAIDEKTVQKYGDTKTWNRDIWAKLVEKLNEGTTQPAVIALDIMFVGNVESVSDKRLASVCAEGGNVVTAVNAVYGEQFSRTEKNSIAVDDNYIEMIEYPYDELAAVCEYGFANTLQDKDGYIRYAKTKISYGENQIDSFPMAIYRQYCNRMGIESIMPETVGEDVFSFAYTGKSGSYEVISLCDVLEGKIDSRVFANCIVMVGAYAAGMQDAYNTPIQKGSQMYGVEIQANIVEALIEGKTAIPGNVLTYSLTVALIVLLFYMLCGRKRMVQTALVLVVLIVVDCLLGKFLYGRGVVISIIEFPLFAILIYVIQLIWWYLAEVLKRKKVVSAFKKYVAPQVVEEISRKGNFKIALGGENRNIAVLFVDIRGFTPMSESLEPEQVVEILNEYLSLTTHAIFDNGGTLDKFVGDATMAVFNAPFDLDDYIYRAVCTARDIASGSAELEKKLMERFGRSVSFGIGVNCGKAVVGNIGCEYRMDYTAIGDTVNTAARLESNAKSGQILISSEVYEAVKERVKVSEIGVIPLKGKSNGVFVYQLDQVL